jgi:hypothetical protein
MLSINYTYLLFILRIRFDLLHPCKGMEQALQMQNVVFDYCTTSREDNAFR